MKTLGAPPCIISGTSRHLSRTTDVLIKYVYKTIKWRPIMSLVVSKSTILKKMLTSCNVTFFQNAPNYRYILLRNMRTIWPLITLFCSVLITIIRVTPITFCVLYLFTASIYLVPPGIGYVISLWCVSNNYTWRATTSCTLHDLGIWQCAGVTLSNETRGNLKIKKNLVDIVLALSCCGVEF